MITINLFDTTFTHQACSVALQTPRLMEYVRGQMDWPGITVFVDGEMYSPVVDDVRSRFKIGWLHEGKALHPENYERIDLVSERFDAIMTHDAQLLAEGAPFIKTIRGGSWVLPEQWGMYPKRKNVSMILSDKTQLEGHQLRHAIADAGLPIDLYGPQYTPIGYDKSIAYKDYRFAVVVEACREDNFFSEHLIDALAYGCVPIYWGCPNIGEWFDERGFLKIETVRDVSALLTVTHIDMFADSMLPALTVNQNRARAYAITEDWQIEHCLRPFVEAL
jgi:hypothetical protein